MADSTSTGQDFCNCLKTSLEGWREIVASSYQIFVWKENWYPAAISGVVTSIFLLIWVCEPSVLTAFSLIGALLALSDYAVPMVAKSYFDPSKWDESKESTYDHVCNELTATWMKINGAWETIKRYKEESPKIYFTVLILSLLKLAWIGNVMNNLFLTYLVALFVALYPGLKHHGIIEQYTTLACTTVRGLIAGHLPAALGGGGSATGGSPAGGDRKNK